MWFCANPKLEETVCRLLEPIVEFMDDKFIQEICVNSADQRLLVYLDYGVGPMIPTDIVFWPGALETASKIIATDQGQYIDADAPFLNCVLPCGFRFSAAFPPVADGPSCSIRTHHRHDRLVGDYATEEQVAILAKAIQEKKNILIAGPTSSGKTSLLSALLNKIDEKERLVVVEDEPELYVRPGNVVRRHATGAASLKRHIFEALRMRPDWIIVGEVRGAEAYDMLGAGATGHPVMSTVHADTPERAIIRLCSLAAAPREFVEAGIDVLVLIRRMPDGQRRVQQIVQL